MTTYDFIAQYAGTAYHLVGRARMGSLDTPLTNRTKFNGMDRFSPTSVAPMPKITPANTNTPAKMMAHRAGQFISKDIA